MTVVHSVSAGINEGNMTGDDMEASATVAERGADAVGDVKGGAPVEAEGLPELRFVHPLPGFPRLQRFVLVRIGDEQTGDVEPADDEPANNEPADVEPAKNEPVGESGGGTVPLPRPASELGPGEDGRPAAGDAGEGLPLRDAPGRGSSAGAAADAIHEQASASESLLFELRSLESPEVRFLVGAPAAFFSDYELELDEQACADLELADAADALVLVILSVGSEAALTTANLLAPVVINSRTRTAAQVILTGTDWPVRASIG